MGMGKSVGNDKSTAIVGGHSWASRQVIKASFHPTGSLPASLSVSCMLQCDSCSPRCSSGHRLSNASTRAVAGYCCSPSVWLCLCLTNKRVGSPGSSATRLRGPGLSACPEEIQERKRDEKQLWNKTGSWAKAGEKSGTFMEIMNASSGGGQKEEQAGFGDLLNTVSGRYSVFTMAASYM